MIHLNWWKGRTYNLLSKALLEIWQETKSFTDKQKLREFSSTNTKGASPGGKEKAVTRSRITNGKAHWSRQTYSEGRKSSATNMVSKSATVRRAQMKDIGNAPKKTITGQYHWCEHRCKNPQQNISNNTLKGSYTMIKWGLSQGCKYSSVYADQSMWYTILAS